MEPAPDNYNQHQEQQEDLKAILKEVDSQLTKGENVYNKWNVISLLRLISSINAFKIYNFLAT